MTKTRELAANPEDLTSLFVQRANAGDAEGMAELYAADAVLAFPPGSATVGRDAIRRVCEQLLEHAPRPFGLEESLPTIRYDDLALTSTRSKDGKGIRVQVTQRQPDGSWLRIIDRPEMPASPGS
jgi:ketosteroid isomerase-like protein